MSETRKLSAILCSDVVGYSRLAGADEDRILARLRALRSDLIDPTIAVHHGRIVERTGDCSFFSFRSFADAVRCATESRTPLFQAEARKSTIASGALQGANSAQRVIPNRHRSCLDAANAWLL